MKSVKCQSIVNQNRSRKSTWNAAGQRDYSMESAYKQFLFMSCNALKKEQVSLANEWVFWCIVRSDYKSFVCTFHGMMFWFQT